MLRKTTSLHFFAPTVVYYSTFHYMHHFESEFPSELKSFIQSHYEFAKKLNTKAVKLYANTSTRFEIRAVYTGKEIDNLIEELVQETASDQKDELINVSRMISKWCARDRMIQLGLMAEVENLHRDNVEKYGNPIGPTPGDLKQKYGNDSKEIAAASKRFRPDDQVFQRR